MNVRKGEDTAFRIEQSEQELALENLTYACRNEKKKKKNSERAGMILVNEKNQ